MTQRPRPPEPRTAAQSDAAADHTGSIDKLVQRALHALGPPNDGAQELQNIALAKRLVAVLLAFRLIHLARGSSNENDENAQPNNSYSD